MKKNGKNEELQSRREFFKRAAKGALPILAGAALLSSPILSETANAMSCAGCNNRCMNSCFNTCHGTCSRTCSGTNMRAWNQIAPLLEKYLQKERVSQILLLPLPCLSGLINILICNTKIGEKSDIAKS